jgi:hypothetical protein
MIPLCLPQCNRNPFFIAYVMGFQPLCSKGPRRLLFPCLRAARGKITMSGIFNCINNCEIFIVYIYIYIYIYTQFIGVAAGRGLEIQGLRRSK